jgi:hypothetical protein
VPLPPWLRDATGLPEGATYDELEPSRFEKQLAPLARRLELVLCGLIRTRHRRLERAGLVATPPSAVVYLGDVPCSEEVHRLFRDAGFEAKTPVAPFTFGDLFRVRGLGPRGVLHFAADAELAADAALRNAGVRRELGELVRRARAAEWASLLSHDDPRFADLLAAGKGSLSDQLAKGAETRPAATNALPEIFARIERIENSPLDVALSRYVSALYEADGARLAAVLARLGLNGDPPRSLAKAADLSGMSWERVRQLEARGVGRIPSHPVFMPALDRALALVGELAPAPAQDVAGALRAHALASVPFHPASVLAAARLCGRASTFGIEETPSGPWVVEPDASDHRPLVRLGGRAAATFGVASVADYLAMALNGKGASEARARHVLQHHCGARAIDGGWFWLPRSQRNRIVELTQRMLSVSSPLDIWTIRAGVERAYAARLRKSIPPPAVLESFFRDHPSFSVDPQGRIAAASALDYRAQLGKWDQILVKVLRSSQKGVLDRASLRQRCLRRGMTRHSFEVAIQSSVVLDHPSPDQWCLRGQAVTPSAALIPTMIAPASETAASDVAKLVPKKRQRRAASARSSKATTTSATAIAAR